MFSFTPGNGCIHSSRGLGRKLAALSIIKEILRNGMVDSARIAMLTLLQTSARDRNKIAPQIFAPFIYVDSEIKIPTTQLAANADQAKLIDQLIDQWAEQAVGAYLLSQTQDKTDVEKTATQANIEARREQESADIQIRRWLDQYFVMTQIQQQRAFSDENISIAENIAEDIVADPTKDKPKIYEGHANVDPEVLRVLVEILRDPLQITADQIKVWRDSPATVFAHVSDAVIAQGFAAVLAMAVKDPTAPFDKNFLYGKVAESQIGAADAEQAIIPNPDQTVVAEASRMQLQEISSMANNLFKIPVSAAGQSPRPRGRREGELTGSSRRCSRTSRPPTRRRSRRPN